MTPNKDAKNSQEKAWWPRYNQQADFKLVVWHWGSHFIKKNDCSKYKMTSLEAAILEDP